MANTLVQRAGSFVRQRPLHFLNSKDEAFLVGLPWIAAVITVALWFFGRAGISWSVGDVPLLLAGLIFIDGVHVVFSFVLLASLPELRQWSASESNRATRGWAKGTKFWTRTALIAAALGITFWLLKISPNTSTLRGVATTWLFLELLGPAQHTVAQMRGISLCYNGVIRKNRQLTDAEIAQAATNEKLERILFNTLLVGEVFYWIPNIFGLDQLVIPSLDAVQFVGGVMSIGSVAGLLVNSLYFPRQTETRKAVFLFRVVLFPLKILTTVGGIGLRAAHGTEYLVIFRRMVQNSNVTKEKKTRIFVMTAIISVLYAGVFCLTWPIALREITGFDEPKLLLGWALLGTFIIRFTHYYTDSVMYRMSDPATRAAVGPLLTSSKLSPARANVAARGEDGPGLRRQPQIALPVEEMA